METSLRRQVRSSHTPGTYYPPIHPLQETWDQARVNGAGDGWKTKYDIRFNLVGHELAAVVVEANGFADLLESRPDVFEVECFGPI